jgi:hypothetical protein
MENFWSPLPLRDEGRPRGLGSFSFWLMFRWLADDRMNNKQLVRNLSLRVTDGNGWIAGMYVINWIRVFADCI